MAVEDSLSFEKEQLKFERVQKAYAEYENSLQKKLAVKGLDEYAPIYFRIFKKENVFQIWKKSKMDSFVKFAEYKICAASGQLGPKRKQGDKQVPEGFYQISVFNPLSLYDLSLGLNYPNESDIFLSSAEDKGGDIYIHGQCASIGCLAMDSFIFEIYILAVKAKAGGQDQIPVHIFPFKMFEKNFAVFSKEKGYKSNCNFWKNLQTGFLYFNNHRKLFRYQVNENGVYSYQFNQ